MICVKGIVFRANALLKNDPFHAIMLTLSRINGRGRNPEESPGFAGQDAG